MINIKAISQVLPSIVLHFNARKLARSQAPSVRLCHGPTRPRFSTVLLSLSSCSELAPKVHVARHASNVPS